MASHLPFPSRVPCALLLLCAVLAVDLGAQSVSGISRDRLEEVMPGADRFESKRGDPPVIRAYDGEELLGFVFLTRDIPPEQQGYSGPVRAIVGLGVDGRLTGARVTEYYESYRSSMGDFLRRDGVQEQFAGKSVADPFEVNGDVDGVTRATISTRALARGIRNASRRVAQAYGEEVLGDVEQGPIVLEELSWFEMRSRGVLKRMLIEDDQGYLDISMTHLPNDSIAEFFVGEEDVPRLHAAAERQNVEDPTYLMYALEGPRLRLFVREGWYVEQGGDTLELPRSQIYSLGMTRGGRVDGEAVMAGVFMLDDRIDVTRPFTMMYDLDDHEGHYLTYFDALDEQAPPSPESAAVAATEPSVADAPAVEAPEPTADSVDEPGADAAVEGATAPSPGEPSTDAEPTGAPDAELVAGTSEEEEFDEEPVDSAGTGMAASGEATSTGPTDSSPPPRTQEGAFDFSTVEEESELARTLAGTDWSRVVGLSFVLGLALVAFFLKNTALRYAALAATIAFLGFLDGSFLSISHVTAAIWVGPDVFLRDLPLLIMVVVTVVTTLVWGRVFCGVLCPFGALQDMIERVVPRRFRIDVPRRIHLPALKAKYVILALILVPALLGSRTSLYQYFEPFGTVFFLSPSFFLWMIAGAFLVASAVVPRFYCRYACPLGAGLAVASFLSLRRIGRVEQCDVCKVCENDCPTGAIEGPKIDFKECVRCNRCETNLIEKVGVCRHDMADVRPRLVQLKDGRQRESAGV
ncbi:MAG: 4Fe-4S binding protein [Gemmatimonadota bacterium]|nr:4Fe-4S binding protein [Gemmatimonadota bacterium]